MSVRTFTRRFREETGVSPAQWLTAAAVERARHLLETTELSVDQVARGRGLRHGAVDAPAPAGGAGGLAAGLPAHLPRVGPGRDPGVVTGVRHQGAPPVASTLAFRTAGPFE